MTVYIEYAIIDNYVVDYILLSFSLKAVRTRFSWWQICLASVLGTVFACFMPLLSLPYLVSVILKIFVGQVMVLISGRFKGVYEYIKAFVCFIAFTFAMGGALMGICYILGIDYSINSGLNNLTKLTALPVGIIIFSVFIGCKIMFKLFVNVRKKWDIVNFERKVGLFDGDGSVILDGIIDTGNRLYDSKSGKPVCVVSKTIADKLLLNGTLKMRGAHFIPCATIGGSGKILVFEIDHLMIYSGDDRNIIDNAMIGVSPSAVSGAEIIINAGLISDGYKQRGES